MFWDMLIVAYPQRFAMPFFQVLFALLRVSLSEQTSQGLIAYTLIIIARGGNATTLNKVLTITSC